MFLVVLRHSMDDIPYRLCKTRKEAESVARRGSVRKGYEYAKRIEIDCSTPSCWWIYEFKDGELIGGDYVRDADDVPPPKHETIVTPGELAGSEPQRVADIVTRIKPKPRRSKPTRS